MQYRVDSLGLSGGVTQVLRDLIHQRLGLFYDATQFDQVADRLAPLVVARGLSSFMDYYYFLKYSEDHEEWPKVMDALAVHETYFWREIDQLRAVVDVRRAAAGEARDRDRADLERALCDRRRTVDAGDAPERGGLVRAVADRVARQRREPGGSRASEAGQLRSAILPQSAGGPAREVLRAARQSVDRRARSCTGASRYDVVNLVAEDEVRRHASAPIIVCRNVFIYFSDESIRRAVGVFERSDAGSRISVRRRFRVAAPPDRRVRAAGHRRRIHVREGCAG